MKRGCLASLALAITGISAAALVWAHSASDAYLTLTVQKADAPGAESATDPGAAPMTVVHGQWDIALRDLDFVLGLDDNSDGNIVWRELRAHQQQLARYAYEALHFTADGKLCRITANTQKVAYHADGGYAALFFDVRCAGAPKRLRLDYALFFKIDPSHRGILVIRSKDNIATSVLSPENASIDLVP
jgi:hypothetical protein